MVHTKHRDHLSYYFQGGACGLLGSLAVTFWVNVMAIIEVPFKKPKQLGFMCPADTLFRKMKPVHESYER